MPYNQFNNDLPVPPNGYADWRIVYAKTLGLMRQYDGGTPPLSAVAQFVPGTNEVRIGPNEPLIEVPYWKIAHYAAREQAEEDALAPQLTCEELIALESILLDSRQHAENPNPHVEAWFQYTINKAYQREGRQGNN